MNAHKELHLDEDQLLVAVVDESDLPTQLRSHLFTCPLCRSNREQFEKAWRSWGKWLRDLHLPENGKELFPRIYPVVSVGFHGI